MTNLFECGGHHGTWKPSSENDLTILKIGTLEYFDNEGYREIV